MKRTRQILGMMLAILMFSSINLLAQRNGGGDGNYSRMQGPGRAYGLRHNGDSLRHLDSLAFRGMRNGGRFDAGMANMPRGGRGFMPGPANGSMRGMGPMHSGMPGMPGMPGMGFGPQGWGGFNRPDGGQLPGLGRLENLPGITDKQKKEIIDLRYKQMAEMEKFRVDMQAKMQTMREEQRKKILELLTEDQKKLLESGPQKPNANAPK
jgi:hypothetical protein